MRMSIGTKPHRPLTTDEVTRLVDDVFPGLHAHGRLIHIESVADRLAVVRLVPGPGSIRPGGTISGPALFTLADFAIYAALIGTLGPAAVACVTSSLNITFLRRPEPSDVIAQARLIRIGRRLAYAEVGLHPAGAEELLAHATASYALPPEKRQ